MLRIRWLGARPRESTAPPGSSLLALTRRAGLPIARPCDGVGICRACVVTIATGAELLVPVVEGEQGPDLPPNARLACLARVLPGHGLIEIWSPAWGQPRGADGDS